MASSTESRLANEASASQAVAAARLAKYNSQPANTRRMYGGYQKEWQVRGSYSLKKRLYTSFKSIPLSLLALSLSLSLSLVSFVFPLFYI